MTAFASSGDLDDKVVAFTRLGEHAWAYSAEGDPTSGVIVGREAAMVIDARATPVAAQDVIARVREVTDVPIRYVLLTHYHAVRVLGASAYGADEVICSNDTRELIVERGEQDFRSEVERFPRLFRAAESVPGLTWPTRTFSGEAQVDLGGVKVELRQLGRGHTKGDTVAWLPSDGVLFAGDLVENGATPYAGDAYLRDWPATLERVAAVDAAALVPGRGLPCTTREAAREAIAGTRDFVEGLRRSVQAGIERGADLKGVYDETLAALRPRFGGWAIFEHCMPFDVSRCHDELTGHDDPRIWTAARDREMWTALASAAR